MKSMFFTRCTELVAPDRLNSELIGRHVRNTHTFASLRCKPTRPTVGQVTSSEIKTMFLPWIDAEFEMGPTTAQKMMHVAEVYGKNTPSVNLTLSAIYELAAPSTPESVRTADSIIQVGLALKRQKDRLPHGMFLPWIEAEFEMDRRTASNLMSVADKYGAGEKWETISHLNATALYELAAPSTPESVRTAVEELLVDGEKVTVADIKLNTPAGRIYLKNEGICSAAPCREILHA